MYGKLHRNGTDFCDALFAFFDSTEYRRDLMHMNVYSRTSFNCVHHKI